MQGRHIINATGWTIRIVDDAGEALVTMPPAELKDPEIYRMTNVVVDHVVFGGNGARVPIIAWRHEDPGVLPEPSDTVAYVVFRALVDHARTTDRPTHDLLVPFDPKFDREKWEVTFRSFERA
jgi:hypothetical protein